VPAALCWNAGVQALLLLGGRGGGIDRWQQRRAGLLSETLRAAEAGGGGGEIGRAGKSLDDQLVELTIAILLPPPVGGPRRLRAGQRLRRRIVARRVRDRLRAEVRHRSTGGAEKQRQQNPRA